MTRVLLSVVMLFLLGACTTYKNYTTKHESLGADKSILLAPNESLDTDETTKSVLETELLWDNWGVPHIFALNNEEMFYAFGWAQMTSHANTILRLYGKSRGRAAEYWGEQYLENDQLVHTLGFATLGEGWYQKQSPEFQGYIDNFVAGMNAYASAHPEQIKAEYQQILPVGSHDVLQHALFVLYSRFVGGNNLQKAGKWEERGSNTYAVGPQRSASGNAMLVMNPHLPWYDEWLFYEGHFNAPGIHMYGATLVGLPTLGIAFNEHLGWSHTNNTIDNADLYQLTLQDNGYVVDGKVRPFRQELVILKVKEDDGHLSTRELPRMVSPDHGPVLKVEGTKALAIKMPGFDRPYGIVQWWNMAKASNLVEFKAALKEVQIPFFNIMYADKVGNIFYMFNGQVPKRAVGDWDYWSGVVDGSNSDNLWYDVHDYYQLPKTQNPPSGYLQNANDPPWTSTFPRVIEPDNYPSYMAPIEMGFRPQRAARMMEEDTSITFEELMEYKTSTRIEMADRLLDDLKEAVDQYGTDDSRGAMEVLQAWDRQADADSRGMALFYAWAHSFGPNTHEVYKEQWSMDKALSTPDGFANPELVVRALEGVVAEFREGGLPLDIPWGDVYRIKYGKHDLPGNGADGSVGIFRVAWSQGLSDDGKYYITGGDSWQSIIEFGDRVRAKVLMSYGNSTQEDSPHYGDQLVLFSKKEMRDCLFYRDDVLQHVQRRYVIKDGNMSETAIN